MKNDKQCIISFGFQAGNKRAIYVTNVSAEMNVFPKI